MIQTIIVVLVVLAAAFFLGRTLWRQLRGREKPGCGFCPANCDRAPATENPDNPASCPGSTRDGPVCDKCNTGGGEGAGD